MRRLLLSFLIVLFFLVFITEAAAEEETDAETAAEEAEYEETIEAASEIDMDNSAVLKEKRGSFYIAPNGEIIMYGLNGPAFGGGLVIDYGTDKGVGIKFLYAMDLDQFIFMEFQLFIRYYFFGKGAAEGLFLQGNSGVVFFSKEEPEFLKHGSLSAGMAIGWRYLIGKRFFAEMFLRGGYPYFYGAGLSAGVRI